MGHYSVWVLASSIKFLFHSHFTSLHIHFNAHSCLGLDQRINAIINRCLESARVSITKQTKVQSWPVAPRPLLRPSPCLREGSKSGRPTTKGPKGRILRPERLRAGLIFLLEPLPTSWNPRRFVSFRRDLGWNRPSTGLPRVSVLRVASPVSFVLCGTGVSCLLRCRKGLLMSEHCLAKNSYTISRVRQWKTIPWKNLCISAMVVRIPAKLSNFVCEYSHNISCKFHWRNWYDSTNKIV